MATIDTNFFQSTMPLHPKSAYLSVRVPDKTRIKFHSKATKHGVHSSEALRELIDAFIEDRVTIQPRVTRNPLEKIHVTRS